jgi:hypothetical protein
MAVVRRYLARFENELVLVGYDYDDTDAAPRVLRVSAQNLGSGNLYIKVTRNSDGAVFDLLCEPSFVRERPLNNSANQRIEVDITDPAKPKLVGVSVEVQYPAA